MAALLKSEKYVGEIDRTEIGEDGLFNGDYVRHVTSASKILFDDMCKKSGAEESFKLFPDVLVKPSITKAQLAEWLFSAVYLLDRCSLPLMDLATDQKEELDGLKNEKISDQKKIIQLQSQLIEKKDEELDSVKKTVQTELKSYSSVLQQSCTVALTPKKIASAVKKVNEEEDRSRNVVVFGVAEENDEKVDSKVTGLLEQLDEKPIITDCRRIGQPNPGTARPIKFRVSSMDHVYQILRKAKRLKDIDGYRTVYISPDRTIEERISRQKLVNQLKEKRNNDPTLRYFIRKGEIVSVKQK